MMCSGAGLIPASRAGGIDRSNMFMYANLLFFLTVIFVLSTDVPPDAARLGPFWTVLVLVGVFGGYFLFCARVFRRVASGGTAAYFRAEKRLTLLAVGLFTVVLHGLDLKYYLHALSVGGRLPVLENCGGLLLFFAFLALLWDRARPSYQLLFHRTYHRTAFILTNIRTNLPIILPWLVLSLLFDLLGLFELPRLNALMNSPWGDLVLFGVFIVFLLFFFPPLVRFLWNCRPMPAGVLRDEMERFCRRQGVKAPILIWPLYDGQVVTAAIMGILPGLRYLLVTPALLQTMDREELLAVLAHEIGHVKKKHLLFYVALFLGFSLFAGAAIEPLPYLVLRLELPQRLTSLLHLAPEKLMVLLTTVPFFFLMILYFRFLFGYFIRNFERQADLHVFQALGSSRALISSFEKIAVLGGNIREQKSWHHFGLGERINFLLRCERDRSLVRRHDRKVLLSLMVYFLVIAVGVWSLGRLDYEKMTAGHELGYVEAVLEYRLQQEPENGLLFLLLGDLLLEKKLEARAVAAYERALQLRPGNAEVYNNLAWLRLTAREPALRDPARALVLARRAVELKKSGYILDTLAVALWANRLRDEAMAAEMQALEVDPANAAYYRQQLEKIRAGAWNRDGE